MEFVPHSASQEKAIFSEKKILAYLTGIQVGKTTVGALRTKIKMHTYTDPEDAFIIAAPTYKILQQSTLPAFMNFMKDAGTYNKWDAVFSMYGGGKCYMRTATEPDSVVGITNVRHIWVDEAGKVSLYFFENIMARSALRNCQIDLTSSPYTLNWLYKQIVFPKKTNPASLPDVDLITAASWENPYMAKETIEYARQTMDARRFNALFGGNWERMNGLVYDCVDEKTIQIKRELVTFPQGTRFFAGIDWGFTHPWVLLVHALTPLGRRYQVFEIAKAGLTIEDIAPICQKAKDELGIKIFYAGPDQPASIAYLNRHGIPTVAANNDVRLGIDLVYGEIKSGNFQIIEGSSPHTLNEFETYHYRDPKDLKPDQDEKEDQPVKQDDDCMDCLRYVTVMTTESHIKHKPKIPGQRPPRTESEKIKDLLKDRRGKRA